MANQLALDTLRSIVINRQTADVAFDESMVRSVQKELDIVVIVCDKIVEADGKMVLVEKIFCEIRAISSDEDILVFHLCFINKKGYVIVGS